MTLLANATFIYGQGTANQDGTVTLRLSCANPGPNMPGDYIVTLTSADVTTVQNASGAGAKKAALDGIVTGYLRAQFRPTTAIQSALDNLVGQTLTGV